MDIKTQFNIDDIVDVVMPYGPRKRARINYITIKVGSDDAMTIRYDIAEVDKAKAFELDVMESRIHLVPRVKKDPLQLHACTDECQWYTISMVNDSHCLSCQYAYQQSRP